MFRNGSSKAADVALRRVHTSRDAEKLQVITEKAEELVNILLDQKWGRRPQCGLTFST
ncbi:hypothetical protein [Streptomyces sp. NPDC058623]|uniref:hypothetical protein n=1 Tax=Streptomyces sp. NPDC058623 TaxID=3346563 RepID=UPI00364CF5E5